MRESLLDRCPVSSYDEVCEVVKKELGGTPDEVCNFCLICEHLNLMDGLLSSCLSLRFLSIGLSNH